MYDIIKNKKKKGGYPMTLQIYPFSASESKIDGLRIINVKMVTDDRGTVLSLIHI